MEHNFMELRREAIRRANEAKTDPWVKVGTTTIDGTLEQVARMLDAYDAERAIDAFMQADGPWIIGGRHLLAKGSHINSHAGTALVRCDIVRRQSEIDAEHLAAQMKVADERSHMMVTAFAKTCPECGPHGNRGEVLLASSWAKCTTCAGGKPGDLWGEVRPSAFPGVKSYTLAIGDLVFDEDVEVQRAHDQGAAAARAARGLRGAREVAALRSSLTEATVDNLRRYEALMSDFKAGITIPNAPPSGYPTHDEHMNYLSARTGPATSPHAAPERPVG